MMRKEGISGFEESTISLAVGLVPTAAAIREGNLLSLLSLDPDPVASEIETPPVCSGPIEGALSVEDDFSHLYEDFGEREMEYDTDGEELRAGTEPVVPFFSSTSAVLSPEPLTLSAYPK